MLLMISFVDLLPQLLLLSVSNTVLSDSAPSQSHPCGQSFNQLDGAMHDHVTK